jgi:hypothetical protein
MSLISATEQIGERIETALYVCEIAPYRRLDIRDLVLPHWTISHVVEGIVTLSTGGQTYRVCPGDVMIHPPGIAFDEVSPGGGLPLLAIVRSANPRSAPRKPSRPLPVASNGNYDRGAAVRLP